MTQSVQTEEGRMGRLVYGRIAPNEDLVQGLQAICQAQGVRHALVRVGLQAMFARQARLQQSRLFGQLTQAFAAALAEMARKKIGRAHV